MSDSGGTSAFICLAGSDGVSPPASQQQAVSWEFQQLGLSEKATSSILKIYPAYLKWDVVQDLQPAIQQWHDQLGQDVEKALRRDARLLSYTAVRREEHFAWLISIGVQDPQKLAVKEPRILRYSLKTMQDRVNALVATGCSSQQIAALIERHPSIILKKEEALQNQLLFVAHVLEVPVTSSEVLEFVMTVGAKSNFFTSNVNTLREGLAFLKKTGVSKKGMANGLKLNVCSVTPGVMMLRCQHLTARLGLRNKCLPRILGNQPGVLLIQPARVDINLKRLEYLGFSASQVQSMATRQPGLLTTNWDTASQKEKWHVLTNIVGMPLERMVGNPTILLSAMKKILPRWQFLCLANAGQLKNSSPIDMLCSSVAYPDKRFAEVFSCTGMHLVYDESFKKACLACYVPKFLDA
ncbi:hypothetical protein WJX77_001311 [Trebouxia sp. C0004]